MKQILVTLLTLCVFSIAQAQEQAFTISYGDVTTDVEDTSVEATGWRVDLLFESHPAGGKVIHGLGIGWIETEADYTSVAQTFNYKLQSLPIYYAPKFQFGKNKFKGFVKGALGLHYSEYERTGTLGNVTTEDTGFYGGVSLGASFALNPKVFINLEYEWDYLSNSYYKDETIESIILGIGFKR